MIRITYLVDKAVEQEDGKRPSRMVTDEHPTGVSFAMGGPFLIVNAKDENDDNVALAAYHGDRVIKVDIDVPGKKNPVNLLETAGGLEAIQPPSSGPASEVPASGVGRPAARTRQKAKA